MKIYKIASEASKASVEKHIKESWQERLTPPDPTPKDEYEYNKEKIIELERQMEECPDCKYDVKGYKVTVCENCGNIEEEVEDLKEENLAYLRKYDIG